MASRLISCSPVAVPFPPGCQTRLGVSPALVSVTACAAGKSRSAVASLSRYRDEGLLCFYSPLPSTNPPPASTILLGPDEGRGLAESPSRQGSSPGQGRRQTAGCCVTERRFTCLFFPCCLFSVLLFGNPPHQPPPPVNPKAPADVPEMPAGHLPCPQSP